MMLIGLVGLIGAGKGTVAQILQQQYGFQVDSFAAPLKDAVSLIFNWPRDMVEGATNESRAWREQKDEFWSKALDKDITPRLALQWMGTEAGRDVFGKNLWTAALINRIDPKKDYVISDVRFLNEVEAIMSAGGSVWIVKRGPDPEWVESAKFWLVCDGQAERSEDQWRIDDILTHLPHRSEWDWMAYKGYLPDLNNNGTIEDLKGEVKAFLGWVNPDRFL